INLKPKSKSAKRTIRTISQPKENNCAPSRFNSEINHTNMQASVIFNGVNFTKLSFTSLLPCRTSLRRIFFFMKSSFKIRIFLSFLIVNLPGYSLLLIEWCFFNKHFLGQLLNRNRLPYQLFNLVDIIVFCRITECNRHALIESPSGSSDPMHIIFNDNRNKI